MRNFSNELLQLQTGIDSFYQTLSNITRSGDVEQLKLLDFRLAHLIARISMLSAKVQSAIEVENDSVHMQVLVQQKAILDEEYTNLTETQENIVLATRAQYDSQKAVELNNVLQRANALQKAVLELARKD